MNIMRTPMQLAEASASLKEEIVRRVRHSRERVAMHPVEVKEYQCLCAGMREAAEELLKGLAGKISEEQIEHSRNIRIAQTTLAAIPCYIDDNSQVQLRTEYYGALKKYNAERICRIVGTREECDTDNLRYTVGESNSVG